VSDDVDDCMRTADKHGGYFWLLAGKVAHTASHVGDSGIIVVPLSLTKRETIVCTDKRHVYWDHPCKSCELDRDVAREDLRYG